MWRIFDKSWWSWSKVVDIIATVSPPVAAVRWGYILAEQLHKAVTTGDLTSAAFCLRSAGFVQQAEYLRAYDAIANANGPKDTLTKLLFLVPNPIMRSALSGALASGSDRHAKDFYDEMDALTKMDALIEYDTALRRAPLPILVTFGYARPVARVISGYYSDLASEFSYDEYDLYSIAPLSSIMTWADPVYGKTYLLRSASNDVIYEVPESCLRYPTDVSYTWSSLAEADAWAEAASAKAPLNPTAEQLASWHDALRAQEAYTAAAKAELRQYTPPNISSVLESYPVWARRNYGPHIYLGVLPRGAALDVGDLALITSVSDQLALYDEEARERRASAWPYPEFWAYIKHTNERSKNAKN